MQSSIFRDPYFWRSGAPRRKGKTVFQGGDVARMPWEMSRALRYFAVLWALRWHERATNAILQISFLPYFVCPPHMNLGGVHQALWQMLNRNVNFCSCYGSPCSAFARRAILSHQSGNLGLAMILLSCDEAEEIRRCKLSTGTEICVIV